MGDAETALIYGFGKSSPGDLDAIISLQMDPLYFSFMADRVSLVALQARVLLDQNIITPEQMLATVIEARANSKNNKNALITDLINESDYLNNAMVSSIKSVDCPPISMVLLR